MSAAAPVAAKRGGAVTAALTEVDGRRVAWFRLEGGKHRGAIGPVEGQVIERTFRLALDAGIPVVGEIATSGADVSEGLASLVAWGRVAKALSDASGTVPVILTVFGPCVGGPALLLGLADHVVMTADAYAYVNGPRAAASFTGVDTSHTDLGGAEVHANRSGVASMVVLDEAQAAATVADLLSYLPSNHLDEPPFWPSDDPPDRPSKVAAGVVPERPTASYDVRTVIGDVCDADTFLEVRAALATNVVTGYARLGGMPVGVIANQPRSQAGTLDIEASRKAARFVQCCDAFGVPLLTFVDCGGFRPGRDLEWRGMIRHGAELVHAYANATVPRLCVVLRKAYGGAYIAMDSRGLGNDLCLAWPKAEIAVMGAPGAVAVLQRKKLAAIDDPAERAQVQAELEAEYTARLCTPAVAAERGYVDDIIDPNDTRRLLTAGLAALRNKRATPRSRAKHSNTPL
ncbi:MAG: methylmalonyl-CoA carboxyltransferase [Actinomycetota bacterium]|nr:methylmalonyl-CoA carboxyltransferase [Actinomycetota bacterium]